MVPPGMSAPGLLGTVHVHSDYSHDGRDSLAGLRAWALEKGLGFVGLTDHAEDLDSATFDRYLDECRALSDQRSRLIPGLEFRFAGYPGLHLLALGLRRWIEPATPAEFIGDAKAHAGFTILAHPVLPDYRIPEEVQAGIDAVEVWNTAYNTRYLPDPRAIRLLQEIQRRRPEVVGIAGLDQHDASNDREARVCLLEQDTEPLAALRAGRFTNRGRTLRFDSRVSWSGARLAALGALRWGYDRVERMQDSIMRRARGGHR